MHPAILRVLRYQYHLYRLLVFDVRIICAGWRLLFIYNPTSGKYVRADGVSSARSEIFSRHGRTTPPPVQVVDLTIGALLIFPGPNRFRTFGVFHVIVQTYVCYYYYYNGPPRRPFFSFAARFKRGCSLLPPLRHLPRSITGRAPCPQ